MKIDIICVGKIKENYLKDAIGEYSKRITRFSNINIYEVNDEKLSDHESEKEKEIVLKAEADRIKKYINNKAMIFSLCVEGKQYESESFAKLIQDSNINGKSDLQFIIGGSLGLHDDIKNISNVKLSFSKMTFPHMLMRVILLEQIYRAFKINNNETYHK